MSSSMIWWKVLWIFGWKCIQMMLFYMCLECKTTRNIIDQDPRRKQHGRPLGFLVINYVVQSPSVSSKSLVYHWKYVVYHCFLSYYCSQTLLKPSWNFLCEWSSKHNLTFVSVSGIASPSTQLSNLCDLWTTIVLYLTIITTMQL